MNLPSFLWLWKIAAWSMGFTIVCYLTLGLSGTFLFKIRQDKTPPKKWLRLFHRSMGIIMVVLILLLLSIGLVGTMGHYGSLGHSWHLVAGLLIVSLALISAWSSINIHPTKPWARLLHVRVNIALFFSLLLVGLSGWSVVQKYLG